MDIIAAEVHRIYLSESILEKKHQILHLEGEGESIGAIGLTADNDKVIICAKYGVCIGDFSTGKINYIVKYPHTEEQAQRLRSNDGIIDPWGNLWIGVMNDFPITAKEGVCKEGFLYRVSADDLSISVMESHALIANGLAFSADGTRFYWTDLLTHTVWQYDYNHSTNTLSNKNPLINMKSVYGGMEAAEPDGLCLTQDGIFYQAVFGTSSVLKYNLLGEAEAKFNLPAERITCTAVGGKDDNDLFITTAHEHHTDWSSEIDANDKNGDLGGYLFRVKLEIPVNSKPEDRWTGRLE